MSRWTIFPSGMRQGTIPPCSCSFTNAKLAFENELTHIAVPRGKHTNGAFNIQTINSYHSELKRFVQQNFRGVATKYLNNYVVYHNFVDFAKGKFSDKLSILREHTFTTESNGRSKEIPKRDAVPVLRKVV